MDEKKIFKQIKKYCKKQNFSKNKRKEYLFWVKIMATKNYKDLKITKIFQNFWEFKDTLNQKQKIKYVLFIDKLIVIKRINKKIFEFKDLNYFGQNKNKIIKMLAKFPLPKIQISWDHLEPAGKEII